MITYETFLHLPNPQVIEVKIISAGVFHIRYLSKPQTIDLIELYRFINDYTNIYNRSREE